MRISLVRQFVLADRWPDTLQADVFLRELPWRDSIRDGEPAGQVPSAIDGRGGLVQFRSYIRIVLQETRRNTMRQRTSRRK